MALHEAVMAGRIKKGDLVVMSRRGLASRLAPLLLNSRMLKFQKGRKYESSDEYRTKLISIPEAVSKIKSTTMSSWQCAHRNHKAAWANSIPLRTASRMCASFRALHSNRTTSIMKPEMKGHFELQAWFHAPGSRAALKNNTGTVTYVPKHLHRSATDFIFARKPHIFYGTCTPPTSTAIVFLCRSALHTKKIYWKRQISLFWK